MQQPNKKQLLTENQSDFEIFVESPINISQPQRDSLASEIIKAGKQLAQYSDLQAIVEKYGINQYRVSYYEKSGKLIQRVRIELPSDYPIRPAIIEPMNNHSDEIVKKTLYLKMDGKAFQKGIYIHTVIDSLNELQFILDRSYLALADRKNLTPKERTRYRLVAQSFEKGSFVSAIDIVMATAPAVLPLILQIGPENIWEYTKTTFEFLKLVFSLNQEKKSRNDDKPINITGDENVTNVNYGEQNWTFNAPVLILGESVLPSYKRLSQLIKLNDINVLQLGSDEGKPEIHLDESDGHRFDIKPEIIKTPVTVECEIFKIDKDKGHGKLRVAKKQGIPSGEYNFVIAKSKKTKNKKFEFVESILKEKVTIECWKEILFDPFSPECTKILKLHLLSVQALSPHATAG